MLNYQDNSQLSPQQAAGFLSEQPRHRPEQIIIPTPTQQHHHESHPTRPRQPRTVKPRQFGEEWVSRMPPVEGIDDSVDDFDFEFDPDTLDIEDNGDKRIINLRLEIIKAKLQLKTLQAAKALKLDQKDMVLKNNMKVTMPTNWDNDDDDVGGATTHRYGALDQPAADSDDDEDDGYDDFDYVRPTAEQPSHVSDPPQEQVPKPTGRSGAAPEPLKVNLSPIRRFNLAHPIATVLPSQPKLSTHSPASSSLKGKETPKTFSQRLAERRIEDGAHADKADKTAMLMKTRSKGFGLSQTLTAVVDPTQGTASDSQDLTAQSSSHFDPFTSLHLTKRHIPHPTLTRVLAPHTLLNIKQLLKMVHGPHYETPQPPEIPTNDYVVVGVIASKSPPREHQNRQVGHLPEEKNKKGGNDAAKPEGNGPSKFMVLTLSDLEHEIDLYLFGDAYTRYWKLIPGTVVALLNPAIMPPRGSNGGNKFALKLTGTFGALVENANESTDAVLEIGTARDATWCEARKTDGKLCGTWLDRRRATVCEFHLNLQINKTRRGRMSLNTPSSGSVGGAGTRSGAGSVRSSGTNTSSTAGRSFGRQHNRDLGETLYFAPPTSSGSVGRRSGPPSAKPRSGGSNFQPDPFLGLVTDSDLLSKAAAEAARKKRANTLTKERDFARTLASVGSGVGRAYLKARDDEPTAESSHQRRQGHTPSASIGVDNSPKPLLTAESLGLVRDPSTLSSPSSYKRKRAVGISSTGSSTPKSGLSTLASSRYRRTNEPLGWSGSRKRGWLEEGGKGAESEAATPTSTSQIVLPNKRARVGASGAASPTVAQSIKQVMEKAAAGRVTAAESSDDELEII